MQGGKRQEKKEIYLLSHKMVSIPDSFVFYIMYSVEGAFTIIEGKIHLKHK